MPTGVHLHDARRQLLDAAERVLLREGPAALTSRAVTEEAGCAKGVLHRHFTDFDDLLTALVLDCAGQLEAQMAVLRASAGTGTVVDNLTAALTALLGPVPVAIVPLITFRDELRSRLRHATPGGGVAILAHATRAIRDYLADERGRGRLHTGTDTDALALSLVGGGHLMSADRSDGALTRDAVHTFVAAALANSN